MDLYLRNYETWKKLYNCSYLTANQWAAAGEPNIPLGVAYMTIGILFIIIYILCLRIMCEKHIRKHSCLKIMIHIGLMDVTNLCLNSVYSGYQTVTGSVFCSEPTLNYISGAIVMGAWINCSTSAIILSLNRALELMCPYRIETIFGGFRTYLWLLIPNIYGLYFLFFTPAPSFTSKGYAWFFNPYVGFNFTDVNLSQYESPSHSFHNIGSSLVFVLLYVVHFVALWWKTKSSNNEALGKTRKALLIQCCLICSLNFSACVTYVYIEHMKEPPRLLMIIAQALWIGCNCGPVIIYLLVNKTIRTEFIKLYFPSRFQKKLVPHFINSSVRQSPSQVFEFTKLYRLNASILCINQIFPAENNEN